MTDGRVVVVKHLRDLSFGPGLMHFYSRSERQKSRAFADLTISLERPLTPFVRVFVFRRNEPSAVAGMRHSGLEPETR